MEYNKIDFVITWVDGNDKKWQAEKSLYETNNGMDNSIQRYRDWETLKYWFRAVEENAPWVNKIYFVTWGHIPKWLNTENEKLVIVNHKDFIPEKYLPTFNSCAIELNLHRIAGLSEEFVYFNDDTFINCKVKPKDFFRNGLPCDSMVLTPVVPNDDISSCIHYNCTKLINRYFTIDDLKKEKFSKLLSLKNKKYLFKNFTMSVYPFIVGIRFHHLPTSLKKSTFDEIWKKEEKYLDKVCMNKFRTNQDVSQWLIQDWQIASNQFNQRNINFGKYFNISDNIDRNIREIMRKKYKVFCMNDTEKTTDFEKDKEKIINMMETMYAKKSSFEK